MDNALYYKLYEFSHAAAMPWRAVADAARISFSNPLNPVSHTLWGRQMAASAELFERITRRYAKPEFGISSVEVDGVEVPIRQCGVWRRPFCELLRFERVGIPQGPKILIVPPMSGHYATLARDTAREMSRYGECYVADWADARMIPLDKGRFGLDDYIDYLIAIFHFLGPRVHVMAVCQPSVPVLAAVALMEARGDPLSPASMTLMGGPIDTRVNPTAVNRVAQEKGMDWFRSRAVVKVPFPWPGVGREVYPGFFQLSGFLAMNLNRHVAAHREFFDHLVEGDGDSAERHREFYDEYLAVADMDAPFYLQTVRRVFIDHDLPRGGFSHRETPVDCSRIERTALMTVEGGKDDISGPGQTFAAHALCSSLPQEMKEHCLQPEVGHYGVFNGSRFRSDIAPRIADFIARCDLAQ